jgi:hypothetical protein
LCRTAYFLLYLWCIGALSHRRFVTSRLTRFAACSGAPSHCLPQGSGQGIVAGQSSTLEVVGAWFKARGAPIHLFLRFLRLPLLLHVSRIANKDNLLQLADDFSSLS